MRNHLQDFRIRYSDFRNIKNFRNLVFHFYQFEFEQPLSSKDEKILDSKVDDYISGKSFTPEINCEIVNPITEERENYPVEFGYGFLMAKCQNLHRDYITFLASKTLDSTHLGMMGVYERINPYSKNIKESLAFLKRLRKKEILPNDVIDTAMNEMKKTLGFLKSQKMGYSANYEKHIKFNMTRDELALFFHTLMEKKIIAHLEPANLGFLMEQYFEYRDSASKEYRELSKMRKRIADVKNKSKGVNKASNRLNQKLQTNLFC